MSLNDAVDEAINDLDNVKSRLDDILLEADASDVPDRIEDIKDSVESIQSNLEYANDSEDENDAYEVLTKLGIGFLTTIASKASVADQQEIERAVRETCIRIGYAAEVSE